VIVVPAIVLTDSQLDILRKHALLQERYCTYILCVNTLLIHFALSELTLTLCGLISPPTRVTA
jgi:hypothetical protein